MKICHRVVQPGIFERPFLVLAHPVNQTGSSGRQFSDLDVFRDGVPFMGGELNDKPLSSSDVGHAAETAYSAGASSPLFVAGRQSSFASQPPTYFAKAREKYAASGMYVGVTCRDWLWCRRSHAWVHPPQELDRCSPRYAFAGPAGAD